MLCIFHLTSKKSKALFNLFFNLLEHQAVFGAIVILTQLSFAVNP
jgi:hypothetical protein